MKNRDTIRTFIQTLLLLATPFAQAEWTSTAANGVYTDTANWRDGVIDDVFSGSSAPVASATLTLPANHTLSPAGLTVGHATDANLVLVATDGPRTFNFTGGRVLVDIAPSAALARTLRVGEQGSEAKRIDFDFGALPARLAISPNGGGADNFNLYGSLRGASLHLEGTGTMKLYGAIECLGEARFDGGTSYLYSWGVGGSHGIIGASALKICGKNTRLSVQNTIAQTAITLEQGFLQSNVGVSDSSLALLDGRSVLINRGTSSFSLSPFTKTPGSLLTLGATSSENIGRTSTISFGSQSASPVLASLVGGSASVLDTPASTQIPIVPWAGAQAFDTEEKFTNDNFFEPNDPVTYTLQDGFVSLTSSHLHPNLQTATLLDNVAVGAAVTLDADTACNALVITTWQPTFDLNGKTLTLNSGLILHRNNKPILSNGTLALGSRPLITRGRQNITIRANLVSSNLDPDAPVIISSTSTGSLELWGDNRGLTGTVHVASGSLAANGNGLPTTVSVELARDTSFPATWGATTQARGVGGTGTIQFGNNSSKLLLGTGTSSTQVGVFVGPGGWIAPGRKDPASGQRTGILSLGSNASRLVFQPGSELRICLLSKTEATQINAGTKPVSLGGKLVLDNATVQGPAEWLIIQTQADPQADTVTGMFDEIPSGFRVERVSTAGYGTMNAVKLIQHPSGSLIVVR